MAKPRLPEGPAGKGLFSYAAAGWLAGGGRLTPQAKVAEKAGITR